MTLMELDKKGNMNTDVYIEVGLLHSEERIRQRLDVSESDINYEALAMDIKHIIQNLKKKLTQKADSTVVL